VKFASDSSVKLTVTDPSQNTNSVTKTLMVHRSKIITDEVLPETLFARIELQTKLTASKK